MAERLTDAQWQEMKPPFSYMRVKCKEWTKTHFEIIDKLLYSRTSGWWYSSQESNGERLYIFEHSADMVAFKILLTADPFAEDHGEIES